MKKIFQQILLFLFFVFVVGLGIFAYKMASNTLVFAFQWQETQEWNALILAVNRPGSLSKMIPSGVLLDQEAIKNSLLLNGENISSENFDFIFEESFVKIMPKKIEIWDVLILSSSLYHEQKQTSYQLPSDIRLNLTHENDSKIEISETGNWPKDKKFRIISDNIDHQKILWYVYYPHNNESCFSSESYWNYKNFSSLDVISREFFDNANESIVVLDLDTSKKKQCVIAGYSDDIIAVLDRDLPDFSLEETFEKIVDNYGIIHDKIDIVSTSDIFKYTWEGILDESNIKKNILKKIHFSPSITIGEENILLTNSWFSLIWDFENNIKYTLYIEDLEDVYGRTASLKTSFTPQNNEFIGLQFQSENTQFDSFEKVDFNVISTKKTQRDYELKLCRLDVTGFSRILEIWNNSEKIDEFFSILESPFASDCQKNSLHFEENARVSTLKVTDFFDKNVLRFGLYVISFRNIDDVKNASVGNFALPFSVGNLHIFTQISEKNHAQFIIADTFWKSLSNQQIELFESFQNEENQISYLTGVILGETNEFGILETDFSRWMDKSIFLVARSVGNFGFYNGKVPQILIHENSDFEITFSHENDIFLKGETFDMLALIRSHNKNIGEENFSISLLDSFWKEIKNVNIKPNSEGVISFQYVFAEADNLGEYEVNIISQSGKKLASKKIFLVSEIDKKEHISLDFSLRNAENGVPKNLRERINSDETKPYYEKEFFAPVEFEMIAYFYNENGEKIKNIPFEYELFEYSLDQKNKKSIYKWNGKFDNDGLARLILASEFKSFHHDKKYEIHLKTQDVITGKVFEKNAELFIKIPNDFKTFDDTKKIDFSIENEFISTGSLLNISFSSGIASSDISWKYFYEILDETGKIVKNEIISDVKFSIELKDFHSWEYIIRIIPITPEGIIATEKLITQKNFFITGTTENNSEKISIFANNKWKQNYELLVIAPKNLQNIFMSYDSNGKVISENISLSGGILRKEIQFSSDEEKKNIYVFWYLDRQQIFAQKTLNLDIENYYPNGQFIYSENIFAKNSEKITFQISDENISQIANISLGIYEADSVLQDQKNVFIKNPREILFFGDISSENIQKLNISKILNYQKYRKNIAFFPTISLDKNKEFSFDFSFSEGNKKYTIEAIYMMKNGEVKKYEKEIFVKENFSLDMNIPKKIFPWDKISSEVILKNHTNTISAIDLELSLINGENSMIFTGSMILNLTEPETHYFDIKIPDSWIGEIQALLVAKKNNEVIHTKNDVIFVDEIPSMGLWKQSVFWMNSPSELDFSDNSLYDLQKSSLEIRVASDFSVVIPGIAEDIKNSKNISLFEKIFKFYAEILLLKNEKTANLISSSVIAEITEFFSHQDFEIWKEKMNESELLDSIRYSLEIEKNGIVLSANFSEKMKKYFQENILPKVSEKPQDIRVKILQIQTILRGDIDEELLPQIDKNELSAGGFLDLMEVYILGKRILPNELYDEFLIRFEKSLTEWEWKIIRQEKFAKYARIWFANGKNDKANEVLNAFFLTTTTGISSISEKIEIILLAISHSKIASQKDTLVKISSDKITAEDVITKEKNIIFWKIPREKISGKFQMSTKNNNPIFYEIREKNYLEAPSLFVAKESEFLKISQKIEVVNESAGVDENGNFRSINELSGNYLEKNKFYKVTISAEMKNFSRDFGALSIWVHHPNNSKIFPIDRRYDGFLWDSFALNFAKISHQNGWTFLEKYISEGDENVMYSYYFRPEFNGSYLLPASFWYFANAKEFFANSSHEYFHTK